MNSVRGLLEPQLRAAIEHYSLPTPPAESLEAVRAASRRVVPPAVSVERSEELVPGDPPTQVRVHRPAGLVGPSPAVMAIHGGGLTFGNYDMDAPLLDRWCSTYGVVGVAVEYRLAPEHPYPAGLSDCYAALMWTLASAPLLGIDPSRVGILGTSAGGGIAAAVTLMARDRHEATIAFQILDCPMLDDRMTSTSMSRDDLYVWTREWNEFSWRSYLGDRHATQDVSPYAAPARATDLAGLPPAFVCVGSIDGFRDEDVAYATALHDSGVPTELHVYSGFPHGYGLAADTSAVVMAASTMENWLERQLARLDEG